MADSREVMNIRQASQYLGVSADTLYKYVNEQRFRVQLGNRWRFKKSKIDQWMEEKSVGNGSARQKENQGRREGRRNSVNEPKRILNTGASTCLEWGRKR